MFCRVSRPKSLRSGFGYNYRVIPKPRCRTVYTAFQPICRTLMPSLNKYKNYANRSPASAFGAHVICNRIVGLTAGQRRICAAAPDAMAAVGHGIRMAKQECQQQFSGHRWNCTGPSKGNPLGHLRTAGKSSARVIIVAASIRAPIGRTPRKLLGYRVLKKKSRLVVDPCNRIN